MVRSSKVAPEVAAVVESGQPGAAPAPGTPFSAALAGRRPGQDDRRAVRRAALLSGRRWRRTARWLGLAIFMAGAGLLAYVFWQALQGFQRFSQATFFAQTFKDIQKSVAPGDYAGQVQATVMVFGVEALRVLYLLLLGYLGSAIAAKGIQFFSASEAVIDEAVVAGMEDGLDDGEV